MNGKNIALGAFILMSTICYGQNLEFSGYFENQLFPQKIGNEWKITDYNKLRLNLNSEISEKVSFSANYIYKTYHGNTSFNMIDFMPGRLVNSYASFLGVNQDSLRPLFEIEQKDENFLDNAYVTIYTKLFTIRVGKQQLPWGSGYTWNPTDIFHDKNMTDPTYEKVGVNAFKLDVAISNEGSITGIISVSDDWKKTTKAIKFHDVWGNFDFSVSAVEKYQEEIDFFTFQPANERRRMIGTDFSTELLGLGLWGEAAFNIMDESENYGQYLLGVDYTFENGLYITGEYYRNELGKTNKVDYKLSDWMRLFGNQGTNLGRDYLFLGQSYPVAELLNWSNYSIINLSDGSLILFPWVSYDLNDNTDVSFVGYLPIGEEETEFGEFGAGGFARIRVYF
ncbi:MAG: hypothetical protein KKA84_03090 [Bacteroidetes bacterium]|nr:hypothetical protein [Bacteroidota bacterium]